MVNSIKEIHECRNKDGMAINRTTTRGQGLIKIKTSGISGFHRAESVTSTKARGGLVTMQHGSPKTIHNREDTQGPCPRAFISFLAQPSNPLAVAYLLVVVLKEVSNRFNNADEITPNHHKLIRSNNPAPIIEQQPRADSHEQAFQDSTSEPC